MVTWIVLKGVYAECLENREIASKVMLSLIEFEFGFVGDDKPTLVQCKNNEQQFKAIFEICRKHGWTTRTEKSFKKGNPYFRMNVRGFQEIYNIAGPFADWKKDLWARLLLERSGKIGGCRKRDAPTETKLLKLIQEFPDKIWKIEELCLELRLLPSSVRAALRILEKKGMIKKLGMVNRFSIL